MDGSVFRSEELPAADRFEAWREWMGQARGSDMTPVPAAEFWAQSRVLGLGTLTAMSMASQPIRYWRSPRMARRTDTDSYQLTLLLEGELALDHGGSTCTFGPRDLHLLDSARSFDLRPAGDREHRIVRGIGVDFPKALLPLPPRQVGALLGRRLSGQEGVGALLAGFLVGLDRQAGGMRLPEPDLLGKALLGLVAACLAEALEEESVLPEETRRQVTARRVRAFIRQNLHDPELTPPVVAAAHHISLSYLHRIFQQESPGETVAAWIRARRLEGARRDLADPALRGLPVHALAARWGYPRASDFTRAFRSAYGLPPTEYRQLALACGGA
ncbi:helix-turn-helix domain-containing protein [Streptomyces sp. NPDC048623]|uniref:helix-turn-helix domain-containing protein n=1 Tax=Streptomyces sp. NPDC048623 TaxID=3155761 RepID=UPI00341BDC42